MEVEKETEFDIDELIRRATYNKDERMTMLRSLPLDERSAVFNALSSKLRQDVLAELSFNEALELLDHLDPLRVHHVLSRMKNQKRKERFVSRLKSDRFEKIEYFTRFHPQASVALIHLNYVYLPDDTSVGDTAEIIEHHLKTTGKIPAILVSSGGKFSGEVSLGTLVRERNQSKLRHFIKPVECIVYNATPQDILSLFVSRPHQKIVVIDTDDSLLGVVYSDDAIDLLDSQPATTLYSFAGVESSERPFDGVWDKVKGRYRWLIVNLATCFLAGGVVSLFGATIEQFVALAIFMPMIAGMGGNTSTQTLAVMIRGIVVGEISFKNGSPAIYREMAAAFINGSIAALMMLPIALLFGLSLWISIIAAVAIVFNMLVGGFFGSFTPLLLKYFGKDPATSAGIFISTATDTLGLFFFLGLATLVLL